MKSISEQILNSNYYQISDIWGRLNKKIYYQIRSQTWGQIYNQIWGEIRWSIYNKIREYINDINN